MDPWTAFAKAIVYPLAKAFADAWFDAQAKYDIAKEEYATSTDTDRAIKFRNAVRGLQPLPPPGSDSKQQGSA